jgi:predicted adenylyl cyclase CyaB
MKNIEIKYRSSQLQEIKKFLSSLPDVRQIKTVIQTDIYYQTRQGRLKLRIPSSGKAELIYYEREDRSEVRESNFQLLPVEDPDLLNNLLHQALGVSVTVKKQRTLLMFRNVRIHLDQVENLGDFLEFESVIDTDITEEHAAKNLQDVQQMLAPFTLVPLSGSYADLLIESRSP